jgi:hypothetical protein
MTLKEQLKTVVEHYRNAGLFIAGASFLLGAIIGNLI